MDRDLLPSKIFWNLQANWHFRHRPNAPTLSVQDTVKGLQRLLLAEQGALLQHTLQRAYARCVSLEALSRLDIALYQEGIDQRVWRAQATLMDGTTQCFGIMVARAPGASSLLTQRDFSHLQTLHAQQARYCVTPYVCGTAPVAGGVAAYTVEWLEDYKELVFEITLEGGVFLINAHGAHRRFSPQASRQIWRRLVEILWWYPPLRGVNIQAGDFVGRVQADEPVALKLTTARALAAGTPQLVLPLAWDQPDNAARVRRLGAGSSFGARHRSAARLAEALAEQWHGGVGAVLSAAPAAPGAARGYRADPPRPPGARLRGSSYAPLAAARAWDPASHGHDSACVSGHWDAAPAPDPQAGTPPNEAVRKGGTG